MFANYASSENAWMTTEIFHEWLVLMERKFKKQNRKILLFIDNFSGHNCETLRLEYIKIVYFPANTTSKLQPLDLGIIKYFTENK